MSHYEELVKAHKKRELKLEALVRGLNTQLFEAKGFLSELEESNTLLEETNTELYLANSDLDALNVDLEEENTTLKKENVDLREENSLLDDKFLISKQFALETNGDLEEMKRELQEKNRQLGALQNAMEEVTSEQAEKNLHIMKLKAEIASNFVELESVKVQLSVQHAAGSTGVEVVRTVNAEAASTAETEGVIDRLKQTIQDLTVRSEFFLEEKSDEECDATAVEGHSQLITELRNSVDSLQETLEGFERNLQHAAAQLKIGKDALNHAECERDQMTSSVQRLGERLLAREVEVKSAHKEGRETESIASALTTPVKSLSFSPMNLSPRNESEDAGYTLEPVEDWEEERAELIARCTAYRLEIEESRAQAALQQRQALLADFPTLTPGTKSKSRSFSSPSPLPRSQSEDKDTAVTKAPESRSPSPVLTGTTSVRVAAELALASDDVEKLKSELNVQLDRYDSVRSTNAKLLQKLQAVKGNIQVCCRTRPPSDQELAAAQFGHVGGLPSTVGKVCVDVSDENEISCFDKRSEVWRSFAFDRVWPFDTTQADVFGDVEPLVLSVTEGFNTCLFAYGQTGSGKTFTMNGYGREYGISYRTLQKIFETLELKKTQAITAAERVERAANKLVRRTSSISLDALSTCEKEKGDVEITWRDTESNRDYNSVEEYSVYSYSVTVSMMEIYNEQVFDLLLSQTGGSAAGGQGSGLDIRQAPDGTVSVPGLHTVGVRNLADVMEVFAKGTNNRATTSTNLNEHSSRSHLIMLIEVSTAQGDSPPVKSKLFLVDLAGSERVGKSGVTGQAMKEAQYINKSLSALGDVMEALDQKAKFVPYRNSKLTYLLQDALGGNSRTMMVVTVCPTDMTSDETLFTLQFATRVRNISIGAAKKNAATGKNLEEAVKALKNELKESKKKRLQLEENIGEIKKEQKKTTEKSATVMDGKIPYSILNFPQSKFLLHHLTLLYSPSCLCSYHCDVTIVRV
jgi:Kinesin motor domain